MIELLIYILLNSNFSVDLDVNAKIKLSNKDTLNSVFSLVSIGDKQFDDIEGKVVYYIDKYSAIGGGTQVGICRVKSKQFTNVGIGNNLVLYTTDGDQLDINKYIICSDIQEMSNILDKVGKDTRDVIYDSERHGYLIIK